MTMTNKNFTEIVSVMKIDWLEDPNIIDVLWYELPETQDEAIKLFNYFKKDIVDLERCDYFIQTYDKEILLDFYYPKIPYIKIEIYEHGLQIFHAEKPTNAKFCNIKSYLREKSLVEY